MPNGPKTSDLRVRLSTKGQLVVPREIRERHGWSAGAELIFEDQGDRVILRQVENLPPIRVEDLIGCTGYRGAAGRLFMPQPRDAGS
jgi:AbrB family looped-hinge helix DNA binding protein